VTTDVLLETVGRTAVAGEETFSTDSIVDAVAELAIAICRTEPHVRSCRARRRRGRLVAVVAAVLLVPATAGFAYEIGARTGWFGNPAFSEEDGSEWLRSDAPDFAAVLLSLRPALPLPRGAVWAEEVDRQVAVGRREPSLVRETGVRRGFESYARCAWLASWLNATERGGGRSAARAAGVIAGSVAWPATAATDGGGVVEHLREVAAAARRGDVAPVRAELAANCDGFPLRGIR
jgi:hypothetical protein